MRRIQIHLDEDLDRAAGQEARRRGVAKASLIRTALAHELRGQRPADDPWDDIIGWRDDDPVDDIDSVVYELCG